MKSTAELEHDYAEAIRSKVAKETAKADDSPLDGDTDRAPYLDALESLADCFDPRSSLTDWANRTAPEQVAYAIECLFWTHVWEGFDRELAGADEATTPEEVEEWDRLADDAMPPPPPPPLLSSLLRHPGESQAEAEKRVLGTDEPAR